MHEQEFKVLSDIEHVLHRPNMYVGSMTPEDKDVYLLEDDEFVLTIESTGQLTADEIMESATDVLKEKLNTLIEEVKKL